MSTYTDFLAMTKAEASIYLDRFLGEMGPCLDRLAATVGCELNPRKGSLSLLWSRVVPALAWRAGYTPPSIGHPGPPIDAEAIEPPEILPSWFHHPSGAGYARFSMETLWLIDGAARYLGEMVVSNLGGRWVSGEGDVDGYLFQNQPVVAGVTPEPVSPMQTCAVLVSRALKQGTEPGPQTLVDVYEAWRATRMA